MAMQEDNNPYGDDAMSQPDMQHNDQAAYPSQTPIEPMPQRPVDPAFQPVMNQMPQQPMGPMSQPPMGMASQPPMGMGPQQPFRLEPRRPGIAILGLVLGILGIVFCWNAVLGIGFGVSAIVTGIVSMRKIKAERLPGKGMSIAGLVTGIIASVLSVVVLVTSLNTAISMGEISGSSDSGSTSSPWQRKSQKDGKGDGGYKKPGQKILQGSGSLTDADVTIVSEKRGPKESDGSLTIVITYEYKNTGNKQNTFLESVVDQVSQNGVGLSRAYLDSDTDEYDWRSRDTEVQPNDSLKVTVAYDLNDGSTPVDVVVNSAINYEENIYIIRKFNIK